MHLFVLSQGLFADDAYQIPSRLITVHDQVNIPLRGDFVDDKESGRRKKGEFWTSSC
ncbi:MAG: hypothetical protein NTU47_08165 [Ignavibacteriales bacterium]|nr:hypothetical protein [Ignavibacteriales bacterium]